MILRPTTDGLFQVVGESYLHGMTNGEALVGPLPYPWKLKIRKVSGRKEPLYSNPDTGTQTSEDPRLGDLPLDWEKVERERTRDDPVIFAPYRNKRTGEEINSDPRLLPEALLARGVNLEKFRLV